MKLSAHFSLTEFTKSQTAERKGIDNTPDDNHIEAMEQFSRKVLETDQYYNGHIRVRVHKQVILKN